MSNRGVSRGVKQGSEYEGQEGPLGRGYIVCVQPNISLSCL